MRATKNKLIFSILAALFLTAVLTGFSYAGDRDDDRDDRDFKFVGDRFDREEFVDDDFFFEDEFFFDDDFFAPRFGFFGPRFFGDD